METESPLQVIRSKLFYGLLRYTKSFPDFSIPQRFMLASPREGKELLEKISDSLAREAEILLYVHLPFCPSTCVFCNAFPQKSNTDLQAKYIEHLLAEIEIYSSSRVFAGKLVKCLYLGGGTPTSFSGSDLRRIIQKLRSVAEFSKECSVTCEAHSRDLREGDRIEELSALGVNRISIGCQTFDERVLGYCRRSNRESQVQEVIDQARRVGLPTNIDMMLGLPGQSLDGVRRDLDILSEIAPSSLEYMRHEIVNPLAVSLYRRSPELLVGDDELFSMTYATQEWIEEKGYEQNGRFTSERQFPYRYHWLKEVPFVALGARSRSHTKSICCDKHEDLSTYFRLIEKGLPPIARYVVLEKKEQMYRSLFLNIQIRDGLELKQFADRFGEDALEVFSPLLDGLVACGCIEADASAIRLSKYGRYFVEDVCCFIVDHAVREGEYDGGVRRMPHSSGAFAERLSSRLKIQESK